MSDMTLIETERMHRIRVSLFAYAYEVCDSPMISDAEYDELSKIVDPGIKTGRLDDFFAEEFSPDTGMWIYKHPEIDGIRNIYSRLTGKYAPKVHQQSESIPVTKPVSNMGFKTRTDMKIYIASLGFRVVPGSLLSTKFGQLDFEYDKDWFTVKQTATGITKTIMYNDYFNQIYGE